MSEQDAIDIYGNQLFGRGVQAAQETLGKTYELAFMKALSQLSSASEGIVDQAGQIGVAREIANYKVSVAIVEKLAFAVVTETNPTVKAVLKQLSSEFSDFAAQAADRIINASAFHDADTTVERALAEIFQASDAYVQDLLAPTPGADWSVAEITGAVKDQLAAGNTASSLIKALQQTGVDAAAQSMTTLSLNLETYVAQTGSDGWGAIAAKAGGAALLLDALFNSGYAPALQVNEAQPFYLDGSLADRVQALMGSDAADFDAAAEYLPDSQALAWLVNSIDAGFSTDDLNHLIAAASASGDQAGVQQLVEALARIVSGGAATKTDTSPAGFYRSVFATIDTVQSTYPAGLQLESLVNTDAAAISDSAGQTDAAGTAYRYSLSALNVFVLVGADYSEFNVHGELDLYDDATGRGTFTAQYLADRPELLAAMIGVNVADIAPNSSGTTVVPGLGITLADSDSGLRLTGATAPAGLVLFGGDGNGTLTGTDGDDHLYGEGGDDVIAGGKGSDLLEGGVGSDDLSGGDGDDMLQGGADSDTLRGGLGKDILRGGAGNDLMIGDGDGDILEGGTGIDTYRVRRGDVIRDEDDQGNIIFTDAANPQSPKPITGGTAAGQGPLFVGGGGGVVYRQNDDGSIDFWADGQRVTVLPGADDGGPRRRREDGAPQEDQGGGDGVITGKPTLGLLLRQSGAPLDPSYKTPFMLAQAVPAPRQDPLVLDLDGDGIETLGTQAVTYFDHDANGFAELTGWVKGDDGFLALDRNGDGRINDGSELFGDHTVLKSGAVAANGVQALAEWDLAAYGGNGDGIISSSDAVWASLRVWRDLDSDGFSDSSELSSLSTLGIKSVNLGFTSTGAGDGLGNTQQRAGTFTRSNGSTGTIGEYLLARDATISIAESTVAVSADVAALPEMRGSGNVYDLRQAMARDAGLQKLVAGYVQENDSSARDDLLEQILFRWAGASGVNPNSRGGMIDARKLVTLEHFLAESFVGALGANPVPDAAIQLERAWHDLAEQVNASLMAQSHLDNLYEQISYTYDAASGQVHADMSAVTAAIDAALATDFASGKALLADVGRMMRGMAEFSSADYQTLRARYAATSNELAIAFDSGGLNFVSDVGNANRLNGTTGADILMGSIGGDSVMGFDGNDVIYGLEGNDVLSGCEDDDILYGGAGNDNLFGGTGNDVLDGGAGNDYLNGGAGNDIYVLSLGTGSDHVRDYDATGGNFDVIRVDANLTPSQVRYWRKGDDLYVGVAGSSDGIAVENWFSDPANRVEAVVFANGTTWTADMLAAARYSGTSGADVLQGNAQANYLEGQEGNDLLLGGAGDDVLDGGAGDDILYGGVNGYADAAGAGNDTYLFGKGYGRDTVLDYDTTPGNADTIRLIGLNLADVTLQRDGKDFVISVKGSNDVLRVGDWGLGAAYRIERLQFADGSVLEGAGLTAPFLGTAGNDTLTGTADVDLLLGLEGNDLMLGGAGDDVLDGGAGNDILYGGTNGYGPTAGAGNDTYRFGRGSGQDTIFDYDTTAGNVDTIQLIGLNQADVTLKRDGKDFVISINGSSDVLRVGDWSLGAAARIERVQFADGTVLEGASLVAPFYGTAGNDSMIGTVDADVLMGLAGNDTLQGGAGNDVLDGAAGNDVLYGGVSGYFAGAGAGNDTYVFGRGYGTDLIFDFDDTPGNVDTIKLKDVNLADVTIKRDATTFYLSINGTTDVLKITDWSLGAAYRVERLQLADGTVLDAAALAATPFLGTSGADTLKGGADNDVLRGLDGNDLLMGGAGNDLLDGGAGNDTLYGGVNGYNPGAGAGNDTYVFARGYGQDIVLDYDGTPGNVDTIKLLGLNAADVTIRRDATTFYIEVNGSTDKIRVADWGLGKDYRIERVEFADGTVLQGSALDNTPYLGTASADNITGTADSEIMRGMAGNDTLIGAAGDDLLDGGDGTDTMRGDDGNDVLLGGDGADTMYGGNGNDLLDGGTGADRMYGNAGDDVYWVDNTGDMVNEVSNEGNDTVMASVDFTLGGSVENLTLVGTANLRGTGGSADNVLRGNTGDNILDGGSGNDTLYGDAGNDTLTGGSGADALYGDSGNDSLDGGSSDDYLSGGSGNDTLDGASGTDVLQGGSGDDTLRDTSGAGVLDGGSGADLLHFEGTASFLAGGKGNDIIEATGNAAVIAQNVGDGNDVVRASAQRLTVSLGGKLNYNDLKLHKEGTNLVLDTGKGDSMTFENWYGGAAKPQYLTLQVMTAAMDGFDATGSDPLLNHRVEQFNLKALVDAYDTERTADPSIDRWSMMHKLLDTQLAGYDSEALGGELAQAYAANGCLTGVALSAAQATVASGSFGQTTQPVATKLDPNSIKLA